MNRILVLAPHTDDGELGCGGAISKFLQQGLAVYYVALSTADDSIPQGFATDILRTEVVEATRILGIPKDNVVIFGFQVRKLNYFRQEILEELVKLKTEIAPDLVLMPSLNDLHQDHLTVAMEGLRAFKQISILGYELPWNNITFHTQAFITLERKHIQNKINALRAYKSQMFRSYLTSNFINSWASTRGVQIGVRYAEAFEVIRWIL